MIPLLAVFGGVGISLFSLAASASASAASCTVPAGVIAGDIIVFANRGDSGGGTPADTVPSGFARIRTDSMSGRRQTLSYKLADGTEGGTSLTGFSGDSATRTAILVFRPDVAAQTLATGGGVGEITDANPGAQLIVAGAAPLIMVVAYGTTTTVSTDTFSPTADGTFVHPGGRLKLAWKFYPGSPANVTADMDDVANANCVQGGFITAG